MTASYMTEVNIQEKIQNSLAESVFDLHTPFPLEISVNSVLYLHIKIWL